VTHHKSHKPMPRHEADLTVVDSPELSASEAGAEQAQGEAVIDPATELPPAPVEESAEQPPESALKSECDKLKAERDQLLDRLARLQAEFDNARKRSDRERAEFRDYAIGNVVEQFLPVLDHFELALKATGTVEQLRSGVELIVKQMAEILRQMQVTPVPAAGEPFNPHVHEALGTVERDDIPDHYVAEEVRRGYRLRDRLLRPALVRVASNPNQKSE
jgi:molecular chaperone GrpE